MHNVCFSMFVDNDPRFPIAERIKKDRETEKRRLRLQRATRVSSAARRALFPSANLQAATKAGTTTGGSTKRDEVDDALNAMMSEIAQSSITRLLTPSLRFDRV
jgi:hypothetical protein